MKLRSVVLVAVFCGLLASPTALMLIQSVPGMKVPSWLSAEDAAYLSGGINEVDFASSLSLEGFARKELQVSIEDAVGNNVPLKANAILGNAALQRAAIGGSNAFFGWECYPTYYGSSHAFIPRFNAVSAIPAFEKSDLKAVKRFCKQLKTFARVHPATPIQLFVVDYSFTSKANVAMGYVSDVVSTEDVVEVMRAVLADCDNVEVLTDTWTDPEDYYEYFFKSDHHWNAKGAFQAYRLLSGDSSVCEEILSAGFRRVDGPLYSGAYARNSLCLVEDTPFDFGYEFDNTELLRKGVWQDGDEHREYYGASLASRHWQFYDLYYQFQLIDEAAGTDANSNRGGVCLIADSFGGALLRPLALEYGSVRVLDNMHANTKSSEKLVDHMGRSDEPIIFVGHAQNYASFAKRHKSFFETES